MDVDADTGDVANQEGQSGVVDVDMREGSMNEHNKAPNNATAEPSPPPARCLHPPMIHSPMKRTVQSLAERERTRCERQKQRKWTNCPLHCQKQS
ncbi:hypothetical protein L208DRAFT_1383694 [Tricholoma matsutake]|nr:hypothetical protein L208DRAFT_1383694 [Tricholoma matsutake 945]